MSDKMSFGTAVTIVSISAMTTGMVSRIDESIDARKPHVGDSITVLSVEPTTLSRLSVSGTGRGLVDIDPRPGFEVRDSEMGKHFFIAASALPNPKLGERFNIVAVNDTSSFTNYVEVTAMKPISGVK